jgi:hypothetical protein
MSQAPTPIYTREELEEKLKRLNEKVKKLYVLWSEASRPVVIWTDYKIVWYSEGEEV